MRPLALALLLLGCGEPSACPAATLTPLSRAPTYAVVSSDYGATAIALLDEDGALLEEAWLDSGTTPPGVVATLSGDVSLPTAPFDPCTLVVLDRFGTDVVSALDVCGASPVKAQIDLGASFGANPQDIVRIDERTAWVSRFSENLSAEEEALDRGGDLALVDLSSQRVIDRVALGAADPGADAQAHPTRMVRLSAGATERIAIGTARLSEDFMEAHEGAIALLDPATRDVGTHPLSGLRNCGELDPVPDAPGRLVATCGGATFGTSADRREGAGVVLLELGEDGALVEVARYDARADIDAPVPDSATVPLGEGRVVSVSSGDSGGRPDVALLLDLIEGTSSTLFEATDSFVLHEGSYDPERDLLLMADAARRHVRRFVALEEIAPVDTAGCRGLPPREIARIREAP